MDPSEYQKELMRAILIAFIVVCIGFVVTAIVVYIQTH